MTNNNEWKLWHSERERFLSRDTEGLTKDLSAFKEHILKLQEVCPKDKAGWPVTTALIHLDKLKKEYDKFVSLLSRITDAL